MKQITSLIKVWCRVFREWKRKWREAVEEPRIVVYVKCLHCGRMVGVKQVEWGERIGTITVEACQCSNRRKR